MKRDIYIPLVQVSVLTTEKYIYSSYSRFMHAFPYNITSLYLLHVWNRNEIIHSNNVRKFRVAKMQHLLPTEFQHAVSGEWNLSAAFLS